MEILLFVLGIGIFAGLKSLESGKSSGQLYRGRQLPIKGNEFGQTRLSGKLFSQSMQQTRMPSHDIQLIVIQQLLT